MRPGNLKNQKGWTTKFFPQSYQNAVNLISLRLATVDLLIVNSALSLMSDIRVEAITQIFQNKTKKSFAIKRYSTKCNTWDTIIRLVWAHPSNPLYNCSYLHFRRFLSSCLLSHPGAPLSHFVFYTVLCLSHLFSFWPLC